MRAYSAHETERLAALGFGFVQFFIHPNRRAVQDRIAETIVVKEKSYRAYFEAVETVAVGALTPQ